MFLINDVLISDELYKKNGFEVLKYDRWDICSAACALGNKEKVKIYQFLKETLVRKYGCEFYEQLDAMVAKFAENSIRD